MIEIMVTQTWAYIRQQLDWPRKRWIKVHALKPDTNRSYCGLENHTDTGDDSLYGFIENELSCKKCVRAALKAANNAYYDE